MGYLSFRGLAYHVSLKPFHLHFSSGLAIPYGFAVLMQAMVFFSLNVGYKYQALWEWLADSCEKLFPFLKTDEKDSKLLLSSCSCSEDSDSGNED